jgi:hypothetical protein
MESIRREGRCRGQGEEDYGGEKMIEERRGWAGEEDRQEKRMGERR